LHPRRAGGVGWSRKLCMERTGSLGMRMNRRRLQSRLSLGWIASACQWPLLASSVDQPWRAPGTWTTTDIVKTADRWRWPYTTSASVPCRHRQRARWLHPMRPPTQWTPMPFACRETPTWTCESSRKTRESLVERFALMLLAWNAYGSGSSYRDTAAVFDGMTILAEHVASGRYDQSLNRPLGAYRWRLARSRTPTQREPQACAVSPSGQPDRSPASAA
jgi:hypothetical protein